MGNEDQVELPSLARCGKYTLWVIGLWSGYCLLIVALPQLFNIPELRAVARVAIILVPALIYYLRGNRKRPLYDHFLLREHWLRGVLVGTGVTAAYFLIGWFVRFRVNLPELHFPIGFATWFNFVIGSPLAEEAFFRGVLLRELQKILGTSRAVLLSSLAFALLHLPQWVLLSDFSTVALLSSFATIFVYGIIFALLVTTTRSLWGSLLPHWINNLISLSLGQ